MQGWGTYGMWHSQLTQFFLFILPNQCLYIVMNVCTYMYLTVYETVYELPLLPNDTASETFLHKLGVTTSLDWILITGALAWW